MEVWLDCSCCCCAQDKSLQTTLNIFLFQLDKDGKGSISLYDYFGIFESHGIEVTASETRRVIRLAGEDGMLTKENFFKIVQGSDFFLKSFDKNNDGEVTEVKRKFKIDSFPQLKSFQD